MTPLFSLRQKVSERVLLNTIRRKWSRIVTPQAETDQWQWFVIWHVAQTGHSCLFYIPLHISLYAAGGAALHVLKYLDILQHMGTWQALSS